MPFAVGCAWADAVSSPLALGGLGVLTLAAAWGARRAARCRPPLLAVALATVAFLSGALRAATPSDGGGRIDGAGAGADVLRALEDRPVRATVRLDGMVRVRSTASGRRAHVLGTVETLDTGRLRLPWQGRAWLTIPGADVDALRRAPRVRVWVRLSRPRRPANPTSTLDWRPRPAATLVLRAASWRLVEILPGRRAPLRAAREAIASGLGDALPGDAAGGGLARALVLGLRDDVNEELHASLRDSGAAHVLAVSGLHVALVAGALLALAEALGAARRTSVSIACGGAWALAALAGLGVPVVRASVLVTAMAFGEMLGQRVDRWNALAAAALVAAGLWPERVLDAASCLTFAAAGSLVGVSPAVKALLPRGRSRLTAWAAELIAASLAAWLGLAPLIASVFHRFTPAAPIVNLAAVPLAGLATGASLVTALVSLGWPGGARACGSLVGALESLLTGVTSPGAGWSLHVTGPPPWLLALHAAGLVAWSRCVDPRLRCLGGAVVVGVLAQVGLGRPAAPRAPASLAAVHVLDVGQGSAALVELGQGPGRRPWRVLVDGGGWRDARRDVGESVVAPALWALGIDRLDVVVLSHADHDHRGGLPFLVRAFRPTSVRVGPPQGGEGAALADLRRAARDVGADWGSLAAGHVLGPAGGPVQVRAVWPPRDPARRCSLGRNDRSVVLRVETRRDRRRGLALLPGDLETAGESLLAPRDASAGLLVVGHHGSRSSSGRAFLAAVRPGVAVASAGAGNPWGHPHPEVRDALRAAGARWWDTPRHGAVRVAFGQRTHRVTAVRTGRTEVGATLDGRLPDAHRFRDEAEAQDDEAEHAQQPPPRVQRPGIGKPRMSDAEEEEEDRPQQPAEPPRGEQEDHDGQECEDADRPRVAPDHGVQDVTPVQLPDG